MDKDTGCLWCGGFIEANANRRGPGRYRQWCSTACQWQTKKAQAKANPPPPVSRIYIRPCRRCDALFTVPLERRQQVYCSRSCRSRASHSRVKAKLPDVCRVYFRECPTCGLRFTSQQGAARFCSIACRDVPAKKRLAERKPWLDYASPRGANIRETIRKSVVAERDNWVCGICGFAIDPNLAHPDPLSFTVDHIIPRAMGGPHTYANVQAAHWFCNVARGTQEAEMPRARKRCGKDGCDNIMPCPDHRGADRRPSSYKRGYDVAYQKARAKALAGATICGTCGGAFTGNNPATGGHVVAIRDGGSTAHGIKAECRRCNYGWKRTGT